MSEQMEVSAQEQDVKSTEAKVVPYEELVHVKNDMHKYKRQAIEAMEAKAEYERKLQEFETNQQKSQGKYKELYEKTNQQLEEERNRRESILNSVVHDKKISAVREFAMRNNIRKEALDDLDILNLDSVVVETTDQGRYNVLGADSFVETLKASKPHWFQDQTPPNVNNGVGEFDGKEKTYSPSELLALEKENPALYREIVTTKKHLIRR